MDELASRYSEYLRRARVHFGPPVGRPGAFVKFEGRLIKFLTYDEFTPLFREYVEMGDRVQDTLERGDTLNDVVLKLLRDRAAQLMLEPLM